jgi:hypothetical protein
MDLIGQPNGTPEVTRARLSRVDPAVSRKSPFLGHCSSFGLVPDPSIDRGGGPNLPTVQSFS